MTSHAQAQAYTTQERARQCEPKQKDDGRHGGQGLERRIVDYVRGNSEAWASRERQGQKGNNGRKSGTKLTHTRTRTTNQCCSAAASGVCRA